MLPNAGIILAAREARVRRKLAGAVAANNHASTPVALHNICCSRGALLYAIEATTQNSSAKLSSRAGR
jgi:hypothetical protein